MKYLFALLLLLPISELNAQAIDVVSPDIYLLEDISKIYYLLSDKPLEYENIRIDDFTKINNQVEFGSLKKELWVRFYINSKIEVKEPYILELLDPEVDQFDVFLEYQNGQTQSFELGQLQAIKREFLTGFNPAIPIYLKKGETIEITIRCASFYSLRVPIRILPEKDFLFQNNIRTYFYGIIFGTFFVLFIQMITNFIEIKDRRYLYLALYIFSTSMFIFIGYGILHSFFIGNNNLFFKYILQKGPIQWTGILNLSLILYHIDLFKRVKIKKSIQIVLAILAITIIPMNIILYSVSNYGKISNFFNFYIFITLFIIIILDIRFLKILDRLSVNFFWSFIPPSAFIIYRVLDTVNIIPYFSYSYLFLPLLLSIQIIIFSNRSRIELQQYKTISEIAEKDVLNQREEVKLMVHQIKNPLNNILHMTEKIEKSKMINKECQRIIRYIDARSILFDPDSKFSILLKPLEITYFLQDIISQFKDAAQTKKISLNLKNTTKKIWCLSNNELLSQILAELIANAIKYSPHKGKIEVEAIEKEKEVVVSVLDSGPGIPISERKNIFKKGVRISASNTTGADGKGLGLYYIHKLSKKMNINLEQKNVKENGSVFILHLPKGNEIFNKKNDIVVAPNSINSTILPHYKYTLLILEDEDFMRKSLKEIFQTRFKTIACKNGKEALDLLKKSLIKPDLILCDNFMPVMGGMEFIENLNNLSGNYGSIPVIIHSAVNTEASRIEAFHKGAISFIGKPCSKEELEECISSNLIKLETQKKIIRQSTLKQVKDKANDLFTIYETEPQKTEILIPQSIKGRTRDVFILISKGASRKEIHKSMNISENTLKGHLTKIYKIYNVRSYAQLQLFIQNTYGQIDKDQW